MIFLLLHGKRKIYKTFCILFQSGNIFVFTGMLHECKNDDQLGIVISHEISHCLLRHVVSCKSFCLISYYFEMSQRNNMAVLASFLMTQLDQNI